MFIPGKGVHPCRDGTLGGPDGIAQYVEKSIKTDKIFSLERASKCKKMLFLVRNTYMIYQHHFKEDLS